MIPSSGDSGPGQTGTARTIGTPERERAPGSAGRVILVNGTSSAGKSTLCRALQDILPAPFWHFSSDHFIEAGMRPDTRLDRGDFPWHTMRPRFFDGFHRTVSAFAAGGNDLLVEHIVEEPEWAAQLHALLADLDVFLVSVRCPPEVFVERERRRGNRTIGEAAFHEKTYGYLRHDLEVDSTRPAIDNARLVAERWRERPSRRGPS